MSKYLQLRIHSLACERMTENRQNFLGIPLETDPDSIDISAVVTDAQQGLVVNPPTVFLGKDYRSGTRESFSPPRVIAEVPVAQTDCFPRSVTAAVNMAEKDDGAGFDQLMSEVSRELTSELRDEFQRRD